MEPAQHKRNWQDFYWNAKAINVLSIYCSQILYKMILYNMKYESYNFVQTTNSQKTPHISRKEFFGENIVISWVRCVAEKDIET